MSRRRLPAAAVAAVVLFGVGAAGSQAAAPTPGTYPVLSSNRGMWPQFVDVGDTLSVSEGTWTGSPSSYSYAWSRCDAATWACVPIAGATDASYVATTADRGSRLRGDVTATNADGSGTTNVWAPVVGAPGPDSGAGGYPSVTSSRTGTTLGFVDVGDVLTVSDGRWLGEPTSFSRQWSRCEATGYPCTAIADATEPSYTVRPTDRGFRLQIAVTATNAVGSTIASPYAGGVVGAPAPTTNGYPRVTTSRPGYLSYVGVGDTLTVSQGTWEGSPTSFSYRWARCAPAGYPCTDIDGATGQSYVVVGADRGFRLSVTVTATNDVAGGTYSPWFGNAVGAPALEQSPQLSSSGGSWGSAVNVGDTLSVSEGRWLGEPTSFAYQWRRCNAAMSACTAIAGATSSSYVVAVADRGLRLTVDVTAANDAGSSTATASAWNPVGVPGVAPGGYPSVTTTRGSYLSYVGVGDTLTVSRGTWVGNPTSFSYEWRRCGRSSPCSTIAGATGASYTVVAADLGSQLTATVKATNDVGSGTYDAWAGYNVGAPAPDIYPTLTSSRGGYGGGVDVGDTLTLSDGAWLGEPTSFAYQWRRCDSVGGSCTDVSGATGRSYTVTAADRGLRLLLAVTAANEYGGTVVYAYAANAVGAPGPVSNAGPSVTSSRGGYLSYVAVGDTLTVSQGEWTGNPTSFSYQWRRCAPSGGSGCGDIPGATAQSYTIAAGDYGFQVYPVVTATNDVGSGTSSPWAGYAVGAPGLGPVTPTISNSRDGQRAWFVEVGDTLTVDPGTWLGEPTSFSYEWRRCRSAYSGCTPIAGATGSSYTVTAADRGSQLDVGVTATNAAGSSSIYYTAGNAVGTPAPGDRYPWVTNSRPGASTHVGDTLTAENGTWLGDPTSFAYQWLRCANPTGTLFVCDDIAGETGRTYTVTAADLGRFVAVRVTATNDVGSGTAQTYPQRVATVITIATLSPGRVGGWYVDPTVTLTAEAAPGAAVDHSEYSLDGGEWRRYTEPFTVTGDGLHVLAFRSVDGAGNVEPDNLKPFKVDGTKPTISVGTPADGATYGLGASVTASFACADAEGSSGLASCEGAAAVDTSAVGLRSFVVTAKDVAGNTATLTVAYVVAWPFGSFSPPVGAPPAVNDLKAGSSVPLKFSLGGDRGLAVLGSGYPRSHRVDCESGADAGGAAAAATPGASGLSYDQESKQYVYVWKTQQEWAGTCRVLELGLADTTVHTATFRFK